MLKQKQKEKQKRKPLTAISDLLWKYIKGKTSDIKPHDKSIISDFPFHHKKGKLNMANITPIKDKDGNVVSYRIRVYRGKDAEGKQLKPFTKNWKVPATYKTEKAIQKALEKVAGEFEANCKRGDVSIDRRTFEEYVTYYIQLCERDCKAATIDFYNSLMPLICPEIGSIRLNQLIPEHLNRFYLKLQKEDVKRDAKAIAKDDLLLLKKTEGVKSKTLVAETGLCDNTIRLAFKQQKVAVQSAEKIAAYFDKPVNDLFTIATSGKGLSPKYINHFHSFIHTVLEQAVKEGCINRNIADQATPPKNQRHEAEFFEIDEILKIKSALDQEPMKYRIATYLLISTGIRRGELVGIRWKSIDFEKCTIRIENNVVYIKKKGLITNTPKNDEYRTVNIAPELIPLLKAYKKQQKFEASMKFSHITDAFQRQKAIREYNPEGYLFIQETGTVMSPNTINEWMINFSKKLGMHIHPHKFRHSQASILYASGVDIVTISKRLGHKQVSTTQNIYAHMMEKSDKDASDKIADILFRNQA